MSPQPRNKTGSLDAWGIKTIQVTKIAHRKIEIFFTYRHSKQKRLKYIFITVGLEETFRKCTGPTLQISSPGLYAYQSPLLFPELKHHRWWGNTDVYDSMKHKEITMMKFQTPPWKKMTNQRIVNPNQDCQSIWRFTVITIKMSKRNGNVTDKEATEGSNLGNRE